MLNNKKAIMKLQGLYLQSLIIYMKQHRAGKMHIFSSI